MSKPAERSGLRRLDDLVFAIETVVVISMLSAMTMVVFLDVVDRRLSTEGSKLGEVLVRMFSVEDEGTIALLHQVGYGVLGLFGLALALAAGRAFARTEEERSPKWNSGRTLAYAGAFIGVCGLIGWMMVARNSTTEFGVTRYTRVVPSKYIYLLIFGLVAAPVGYRLLKERPEGYPAKLAGLGFAGAVLAYFAFTYFPDEFSWSQEVGGIFLLWVGALGASICAYSGKHIRLEALQKLVPENTERFVRGAGFLVAALFVGFMAQLGFDQLSGSLERSMAFEQTGIPDAFATAAIPIAFTLASLRFFAAAVSAVLGGRYGLATESELDAARAARAGESE